MSRGTKIRVIIFVFIVIIVYKLSTTSDYTPIQYKMHIETEEEWAKNRREEVKKEKAKDGFDDEAYWDGYYDKLWEKYHGNIIK